MPCLTSRHKVNYQMSSFFQTTNSHNFLIIYTKVVSVWRYFLICMELSIWEVRRRWNTLGDILIFTWPQLVPLLIIYSVVMFLRYRKRKTSVIQQIVYLTFFIYCVLVISETLLPIPISKRYIQMMIESNTAQQNSFIPFSDIYKVVMANPNHLVNALLKQIGGNILLLFPLGFYAPILWRRFNKAKSVVILGFAVSGGIELTQLCISTILGVTYRSFVFDDIILNTVGVLLGYLFFRLISPFLIIIIKSIDKPSNENLKLLNLWRDL